MKKIIIGLLAMSSLSSFAADVSVDSLYSSNKNLLIKNSALKNIEQANGVQQIKDFLGTTTCQKTSEFPARSNPNLVPTFQNAGKVFIFFGKSQPLLERMVLAGLGSETLGEQGRGFDYHSCKTSTAESLIEALNAVRFVTAPSPYETFGENLKKLNPNESYLCGYYAKNLIAGNLEPYKCIKDSELPTDYGFTGLMYSTEVLDIAF